MMNFNKKIIVTTLITVCVYVNIKAQKPVYTHADTLKGTYSKERSWWDLLHYNLHVTFNTEDSSIAGYNTIRYKILKSQKVMQIDLMQPMQIDSIFQDWKKCDWRRDGNAFFVNLESEQTVNLQKGITVYFHGKPRVAKNPPWDGGIIWAKDKNNQPWISIACQGMSAGVWFPNKDHMQDEVDSCSVHFTVPRELVAVSNGNLKMIDLKGQDQITFSWTVLNPINNYNIIPYIGKYANLKDTLNGLGGTLNLNYWVLAENAGKAQNHFLQVKPMLRCFENWFGKYPFYEDGYKLVEAPFLGMEHQSAIAYGNDYQNGYNGKDLSNTGWGLKWDFIIVHESGHEWFGNNISAADVADNWIHESFTAYSENLYVEYLYGKKAGAEYVIGTRKAILNDKPIISDYHVNSGGSLDLYYKGSNMLHTLRQIVDNDSLWKEALRGLNKTFWHKTVTSKQIEQYLISFLKLDIQKMFDQYLRTNQIPVLEYKIKKNKLRFRWTNCVKGFNMPCGITVNNVSVKISPKTKWKKLSYTQETIVVNENYYVTSKKLE